MQFDTSEWNEENLNEEDSEDDFIDWAKVNIHDPELDRLYENMKEDIVQLKELLVHIQSGTSALGYMEIEKLYVFQWFG